MAQDGTVNTVTLRNLVRRMLIIELAHDVVCANASCHCSRQLVGVRSHDAATGARTVQGGRRRVSGTVTLTARGTPGDVATGLPMSVRHLEAVIRAKAAGDLLVEVVTAPAPAPAPAAPELAPPVLAAPAERPERTKKAAAAADPAKE